MGAQDDSTTPVAVPVESTTTSTSHVDPVSDADTAVHTAAPPQPKHVEFSQETTSRIQIMGPYYTEPVAAAPLPGNATTDPPPVNRREQERQKRRSDFESRSQAYHDKKKEEEAKEKRSFLDKVGGAVDTLSHKIEKAVADGSETMHEKVGARMIKDAEDRFSKHFPTLASTGEHLVYHDYGCSLVSTVDPAHPSTPLLEGYLLVTTHHLLFVRSNHEHDVKLMVPLRDVVSVHLGVRLDTMGPNLHCMPIPAPNVKPQGFLVYTRQGVVHRLFDFRTTVGITTESLHLVRGAFGVLDHTWRAAVEHVPVDDYQYEAARSVAAPPVQAAPILELRLSGSAPAADVDLKEEPASEPLDE